MNDAPTKVEYAVLSDFFAILGAVAGLILGLSLAIMSADKVMAFHGLLLGASCGAALLFLIGKTFGDGTLAGANYMEQRRAYSDNVIKAGVIATVFWGIAGFLVGDLIAWQLAYPALNLDLPWTSFGRLRPLHTSAVIFAFGGNALIATSFYVVQRTCRARLAGRWAPWFVFWGYNLFIVIAATGYILGVTQSKEYAEPEWYADIWLTLVWVVYLLVFLGTLARRKEPHIYVANWFYLAFIVTVAMLHVVNNLAIPVSLTGSKSYIVYAGVQDAMTQWWYGHNAVGFFLTAGFLGMMYYFIPKRAERPVYSYKLSIVHFWSLIFLYIWAGPHHLHYTALPDWAQTLGMTFSIMLWMPSWGGMINGLMTLSGAWDKLRTDPVIRFLVVSVAFYGMSTFEGPLMSIRAVNSLSHYTDWTIGHVHSGALGWVAMITFGALYCLVPWLWRRETLHSMRLVEWHFWISTVGILLYITAMWVSGITQGLMWRAYDSLGFLQYSFAETVDAMHPYYVIRATGGLLFLIGALIMAYNLWMTARGVVAVERQSSRTPHSGLSQRNRGEPSMKFSHAFFERNSLFLLIGILLVVAVGGLVEIAPLFWLSSTVEKVQGMRPYSPLELAGRDIYIREGCYNCHSQMIRALRDEIERYGHYSLAAESMYDHPFQWGSKRTGPDLARVGGKYSDEWHVAHLVDPRSVVPESIMPGYRFLAATKLDYAEITEKLKANRVVGVPYTDDMIQNAKADLEAQAKAESDGANGVIQRYPKASVRTFDGDPTKVSELDALVAYLQVLGTLVDFTKFDAAGPNLR